MLDFRAAYVFVVSTIFIFCDLVRIGRTWQWTLSSLVCDVQRCSEQRRFFLVLILRRVTGGAGSRRRRGGSQRRLRRQIALRAAPVHPDLPTLGYLLDASCLLYG